MEEVRSANGAHLVFFYVCVIHSPINQQQFCSSLYSSGSKNSSRISTSSFLPSVLFANGSKNSKRERRVR